MTGRSLPPPTAIVADLYAAAQLLHRASAALGAAGRPLLAQATAEMEHVVSALAALLRAQHERLSDQPRGKR